MESAWIAEAAMAVTALPAWAISHAPALALGATGLALASEILPRMMPVHDPRARHVAELMRVDPRDVAPIADGMQLWHDARARLPHDDPESTLPLGSPTLRASYAVLKEGQIFVVCVHDTAGLVLVHDEEEDALDAVMGMIDHRTGYVHPGHIALGVDEDCARRANLIEAVANTRFGYRGAVMPLVLWRDEKGLAPERDDERTLSGVATQHLRIESSPSGEDRIAGAVDIRRAGHFERSRGFNALGRWLRRQPSRATPPHRIALRAGVAGLCAAMILTLPDLAGHEGARRLLEAALALLPAGLQPA